MLWFVSKDGKISFISLNYRDSNGKDLEQHLKELIESISHSLQGIQCEDRSLDAWYETSQPIEACRSKETAQSEHSKDKETAKERRFQLVFEMVISPIVDLIDSLEIVIVPEGTLFLIPFSALQDSSGGYLSETVRIRLIPSLTTLKLIQDSPPDYHCQSGALIVGDPKVGRVNFKGKVVELCALPKAREEAQMVSALLGVPCLVGEQATKEEVLRRIQEVSLVHIAAHGDVERGEIALAPNSSVIGIPKKDDFMLTMKDIAEVGIRAKLVVLSCCHSASGKILKAEGVVGIARAFLGSGARSVLMSLWAVDDEGTKAFMNIFYKSLIHEKMSAGEALHHCIKKTRESPEYKDLKYWAPFVLLGDDVELNLNEP
ncbi:tetratricopeptide repeat protein 28-like [Oculina patagonica]